MPARIFLLFNCQTTGLFLSLSNVDPVYVLIFVATSLYICYNWSKMKENFEFDGE